MVLGAIVLCKHNPRNRYDKHFVCVGVMYSGEYDVCGVTLSVHLPDHGGSNPRPLGY